VWSGFTWPGEGPAINLPVAQNADQLCTSQCNSAPYMYNQWDFTQTQEMTEDHATHTYSVLSSIVVLMLALCYPHLHSLSWNYNLMKITTNNEYYTITLLFHGNKTQKCTANANLTSSRKVHIMDKQSNKMLFHLTLQQSVSYVTLMQIPCCILDSKI